ncbi:MAG TPA: CPBP family intramembrane glutamic endopeptidase [Bdellovibrionota bacterium]|jgi:membrane protease YdiL (CAAX protease family)
MPRRKTGIVTDELLSWLLVTVLLAISMDVVIESDAPVRWLSVIFLGAVLHRRAWDLAPCAFLLVFLFPAGVLYPDWAWDLPAVPFFVPLILTWITCTLIFRRKGCFSWLKRGRLDEVTISLILLVSLASALVLVLWALWTDYLGIGSSMVSSLKSVPRWFTLLVVVPGFALVNAAAEEAVYRGVMQDALEKRFKDRLWLVIGVQASAFAAAHFHSGFPNGRMGYLMTFGYACMLGMLRRRTGGMLAPYLTHLTADLVIGITLVLLAS